MEALLGPLNNLFPQRSHPQVQLHLAWRHTIRNLLRDLSRRVEIKAPLDARFKGFLLDDVGRLTFGSATCRNVEELDEGVHIHHPASEFFALVHGPAVNEKDHPLTLWQVHVLAHLS